MALQQATITQLRPALEFALERSRAGGVARLGVALPGRIRNLVGSRRLPSNWAVTMCQVLDEEEAFRAQVAQSADQEEMGRLAWLWLARPDGWRAEFDGLVGEALAAREDSDREAVLHRSLEAAESQLAGLRSRLDAGSDEVERLRVELERRRQEDREAAARLRRTEDRVSVLESENASLRSELARRELESAEISSRLEVSEGEVARLRGQVEAATQARRKAEDEVIRVGAERDDTAAATLLVAEEALRARREAAESLRRAMEGQDTLARWLEEAARSLGLGADAQGRETPPGSRERLIDGARGDPERLPGRPVAASRSERPPARRAPRSAAPRPRRLTLPPGVRDDSPEAAEHLVRQPGVTIVVDGYNVALRAWAGEELQAGRDRLIGSLAEMAVRVKNQVVVVFDGQGEGGRVPTPAVARPWLRVLFSASEVEADEVIVRMVEALEPGAAAVVATDDRQVREDVAVRGASVISVAQLLRAAGRPGAAGG